MSDYVIAHAFDQTARVGTNSSDSSVKGEIAPRDVDLIIELSDGVLKRVREIIRGCPSRREHRSDEDLSGPGRMVLVVAR